MPDIDIDFADRDIILSQLEHRVAKLNTGKKHNTGVYATEIPHNPIDNLATVEHKAADERGYFKLDFLNVSIYKDVRDETHLTELMFNCGQVVNRVVWNLRCVDSSVVLLTCV